MNYYNEIRNELINNEINRKVKNYSINKSDLNTYYNVGKMLSEAGKHYGENIIGDYADKLKKELNKKYNERTLRRYRQFYNFVTNLNWSALPTNLSWSHITELMVLSDEDGSPKMLEVIEQRQAHDSNHNIENKDYAVFLTSSFIMASAYAFKDNIKELSDGLKWNFDIGYNPDADEVNIIMDNVNISDDIEGYIYVFPFNENYEHHGRSIQYKCYENIKPVDVVKIRFADFKEYYSINVESKKR